MEKNLSDLIEISQYFGQQKGYVIAGGGNTSFKNSQDIWVKASGIPLQGISEQGFARLHRSALQEMYTKKYSDNSDKREAEVKFDLYKACYTDSTARPSVETSLHELINYSFVIHTHPTLVNAVTCSQNAEETVKRLFGDSALFVAYTDPGYILFSKVRDLLMDWRKRHSADPTIIFLENHGILVASDSIEEVKKIYARIDLSLRSNIRQMPDLTETAIPDDIVKILPAIRMILSPDIPKIASIRNHKLAQQFVSDKETFSGVGLPFTPDQIVYCKARPIYLEGDSPEKIIAECQEKCSIYEKKHGFLPKIIALKNYGVIALEDDAKSAETLLDIFDDWMQISYLSQNFGGPHFMSVRDIQFIENWEVENYRRQVAKASTDGGKVKNKIVVVTGGAQGIGGGITESFMTEGANVVIADMNEEKGQKLANELSHKGGKNKAIFVKTDVANQSSVESLIATTVKNFGGIDAFISNAGILHAGSLDEMSLETFEKMTKVNYNAYFLCAKYASVVMKLQSKFKEDHFTDIIQINSKSGLKGSNKNFAYAGGKFGGIGLTQSFALELMPYHIKVNAICPGNFFEGPLWSDPETGLFTQYLRTGKVPGAKTIGDVKAHYERQVPAGRGCQIRDLMKAIYYVIDQEYETGQAVPVTGGQEMLR